MGNQMMSEAFMDVIMFELTRTANASANLLSTSGNRERKVFCLSQYGTNNRFAEEHNIQTVFKEAYQNSAFPNPSLFFIF